MNKEAFETAVRIAEVTYGVKVEAVAGGTAVASIRAAGERRRDAKDAERHAETYLRNRGVLFEE